MEDKDAAPRTVLEVSSALNTYGSMPTDYGPDISDVPMEDEVSSSSTAGYQSVVDTHDPVTESRQPRNEAEDNPPTPVTPSSPSSVPTERAPSMPSTSEIASRFGATSPPNLIPLYLCNAINDDAEAAAQDLIRWRIKGATTTSDSSMSSDGMSRRRPRARATCPSGWHFVNPGTPLLKTSTETRKLTAPASLRHNIASRLSRGVT
ncbi:hypothetical protein PI124_g9386 [Phytophthora idaei]|nr:hypothetical protein PI125_g11997 [Phytophthora idaei]KAG3245883.1 hypothetical protein PI124_g9386 [Phytophthora idaei]